MGNSVSELTGELPSGNTFRLGNKESDAWLDKMTDRFFKFRHEELHDEDKLPMDERIICQSDGHFTDVKAGLVNISMILDKVVFEGLLDLDKIDLVEPMKSKLKPMMYENAQEHHQDYMLVCYRDETNGGVHVGRLDYLLFYKDFTKEEHFKFQDVLAYTWSVAPIKAESVTDEFIEELFNRQFECEKTGHPGFDDRKLSKFRFVIADIEAQRKIAAQSEAEADANVQE